MGKENDIEEIDLMARLLEVVDCSHSERNIKDRCDYRILAVTIGDRSPVNQ